MYLYCHMFNALHNHSKYCMNIIYYFDCLHIHPLLLKIFGHISLSSSRLSAAIQTLLNC
jgi:hypothetical protein